MRNVLRVLKRDIVRLVKVPPALVVIGALLVLPSLYTWYNVRGFWDPYVMTGELSVCVVDGAIGAPPWPPRSRKRAAPLLRRLCGNLRRRLSSMI